MLDYSYLVDMPLRSLFRPPPRPPKYEQKPREGGRSSRDALVNELLKLIPRAQQRPDDRLIFEQSSGSALKKLIGSLRALDRMGITRTPVVTVGKQKRPRLRFRKR